MGKITVPWPFTTRVPRNPYTTSASCGPALRYSRAIIDKRNRMTRAINAATTNTPLEIPLNKFITLSLWGRSLPVPGQLVPAAHIRDSFFIPRDHHFGPFGNGAAVVVAGSNRAARALL